MNGKAAPCLLAPGQLCEATVCGAGLNVTAESRDDWRVDLVEAYGSGGEVTRLAGPFAVGGCAVGYGCQAVVLENSAPSSCIFEVATEGVDGAVGNATLNGVPLDCEARASPRGRRSRRVRHALGVRRRVDVGEDEGGRARRRAEGRRHRAGLPRGRRWSRTHIRTDRRTGTVRRQTAPHAFHDVQ